MRARPIQDRTHTDLKKFYFMFKRVRRKISVNLYLLIKFISTMITPNILKMFSQVDIFLKRTLFLSFIPSPFLPPPPLPPNSPSFSSFSSSFCPYRIIIMANYSTEPPRPHCSTAPFFHRFQKFPNHLQMFSNKFHIFQINFRSFQIN